MRTPPFHLCHAKFPQPFWLQIGSLHHPPVSFHDLQKSLRKSCHDLNVDHVDPDSGGDTKRQETLEWETLRGSGSFGDSFFEHNFLGDINVTRRITMVERYIYIYIYTYTYNYIYIYIMYVYKYLHLLLIGAVCSTQLLWPFIRFLRHLGGPRLNMMTLASSPDLPNLWSQIWVAEDFGVSSLQFLIECKRSWSGPKSMKMMLLFEAISSSRNYPVSVMWDCSTSLPQTCWHASL